MYGDDIDAISEEHLMSHQTIILTIEEIKLMLGRWEGFIRVPNGDYCGFIKEINISRD